MGKINYKEMEKLARKGLSYGEIADELQVDLNVVVNYLEGLKIAKKRTTEYEEKVSYNRREIVGELRRKDKMSVEEIAEKLDIAKSLIIEDLLSLGINPFVQEQMGATNIDNASNGERNPTKGESGSTENEEVQEESVESIVERRRQIVRLMYKDEKTLEDIYKIFDGIPSAIIDKDIRYIKRNNIFMEEDVKPPRKGKNSSTLIEKVTKKQTKLRKKRISKKVKERREKVVKLIGTMSPREIAKELGVSIQTINNDIKALRNQGLIPEKGEKVGRKKQERREETERRQEKMAERRAKVTELVGKMSQEEIAKELGISSATVSKDIKFLKSQGMILEKKKEEVVEKGEQGEELEHAEKASQIELEERNQSNGVSAIDEATVPEELKATVMMFNSEESQPETENKGKVEVEGQADAKSTNNEGMKEDERHQEEKSEKIPERKEVQTNIHMLNKSNRRGSAESKYIAMMVRKIKELSGKGEIELAIKHLETLQNEINFSEKEERQFYEIMKVLQKARIIMINKKYFKTDNGEKGIDER